jgi:hypothetical protein
VALAAHAEARGACLPDDALLRRTDHQPMSPRRYGTLWERVRAALPWAEALGISVHWLRHTTITWVERRYGYPVARTYAGHTDIASAPTATFARSRVGEIAAALAALTGEPHPLAASEDTERQTGRRRPRVASGSAPVKSPASGRAAATGPSPHLAIAPAVDRLGDS